MTEQSSSLYFYLYDFQTKRLSCSYGSHQTPERLGPEPKAIRKVGYHRCSFSFDSDKVHYKRYNPSAVFHCLHPILAISI